MIVRDTYAGLFSSSAWWHSSGLYGSWDCDLPVGTPVIRILDHLMLALVLGVVLVNRAPMMTAMWLAVGSRTLSDVLASPVRMRFPLAVHLAVMRWTVEWEDVVRSLLMFLQIISTGGWSLSARFQWARSTTMLWVEGLAPATAEKFFDGVLGGCCTLACVALLGKGSAFWMLAIAWVRVLRVVWISLSSVDGGEAGGAEGVPPACNIARTSGCARKFWRCGSISGFL